MKPFKKNTASFMALVYLFVLFAVVCCPRGYALPDYDCDAGRHKDAVIAREEPAADTDGYETLKCELCAREYTAVLYATAHLWGDWMVDKEPTCTEPGHRHRTCTRSTPHNENETIPAPGHDYILTETPPGCEHDGLKTFVCSRCGVDLGIIGVFTFLLIPAIRTVSNERKAYKAFKRREALEEAEAKKHDFR